MSESWNWKPYAVVAVVVAGLWWWNAQPKTDRSADDARPANCSEVFAAAMAQERSGDTAGSINDKMDFLSRNCDSQFEAFTGYVSAKGAIEQFGTEACDVWAGRVGAAAAELLRADGLCTASAAPLAQPRQGGGIAWNKAGSHIGETVEVCGPLASIRNSDNDVFLNIGRDYPDVSRFTIVLWDVGGVESLPSGTTVCATGPITEYRGVAQIELNDVSAVKVDAR